MNIPENNTPTTTPPDWADIDRSRPIEDLLQAESAQAVFDYVLEVVGRDTPDEIASIEVLIEALDAVKVDDHALHLRSSIEAILLDPELRAAIWLGLAIKGVPGAAAEMSQAYARLAYLLADYVHVHGRRASTSQEITIVNRLGGRIKLARHFSIGWAVLAGGGALPTSIGKTQCTAGALGLRVDRAMR